MDTALRHSVQALYGLEVSAAAVAAVKVMMASNLGSDLGYSIESGLDKRYDIIKKSCELSLSFDNDAILYSDISGFLSNAILIGYPYRGEVLWLELPTAHVWHFAEGIWRCVDGTSPRAQQPNGLEPGGWDTVRWLTPLLAQFSDRGERELVDAAVDAWLIEHDAVDAPALLADWHAHPAAGCAHALKTLWGLFFLGADAELGACAEELLKHEAGIVASSARFVRNDLHKSSTISERLWRRRAAFLGRIG